MKSDRILAWNTQKAIETLQKIERPELFGGTATMVEARSHQELEQHAKARTLLNKILKDGRSHERAEALSRLADTELAAGHPTAAFKHLKKLDIEYPTSRYRGRIDSQLKTLFKTKPKFKKKWQRWRVQDVVLKAERLLKRHRTKPSSRP